MKRKALLMLITATMSAGILMGCNSQTPESEPKETEVMNNSEAVADEAESAMLEQTDTETSREIEMAADIDTSYTLVWEDDFESDALNLEDWNYEYHEPGWVNNELQEYVDLSENIYLRNGKLVIQAIKTTDENGNAVYTSGRINTRNKHDFKYGRFEACVKTPSGKGLWPAFWMMPTDESLYGQWPRCGEIDIMEVLGNNTRQTYGTLHFGEPHTQRQGSYILGKGDFADEYHVFACEWEPDEIRFYVDDSLYFTVNDWFTKEAGLEEAAYPAPYNQPFYMILNLAVGGDWPGDPDESNMFDENAAFYVDYVRVYQKDSYDENVSRPVIEQVFREADESGNYVVNGNFDREEDLTDDEDWKFLQAGTGEGSARISDGMIHILTEDAGDLEYSIQLVQPYMPMVAGNQYRISFDAYADEDRSLIVCVSAPDNNWIRYFPDTSVDLTTHRQNYEYEFTMTESDDANGRLEFNMGNQGSTADIHITNIRLERLDETDAGEAER